MYMYFSKVCCVVHKVPWVKAKGQIGQGQWADTLSGYLFPESPLQKMANGLFHKLEI